MWVLVRVGHQAGLSEGGTCVTEVAEYSKRVRKSRKTGWQTTFYRGGYVLMQIMEHPRYCYNMNPVILLSQTHGFSGAAESFPCRDMCPIAPLGCTSDQVSDREITGTGRD